MARSSHSSVWKWICIFIALASLFLSGETQRLGNRLSEQHQKVLGDHGIDHLHSQSGEIESGHDFRLSHVFHQGFNESDDSVHIFNISTETSVLSNLGGVIQPLSSLHIKSTLVPIQRRRRKLSPLSPSTGGDDDDDDDEWIIETIPGPRVRDKATVINLATMTSDAYILDPSQPDWLNLSFGYNSSSSFGWATDGLRGHVFTDATNSTAIIAFKGTTVDPRDRSATKDRLNDNLLFSCCCAAQRPDPYWYGEVCGCRTDTYRCNSTCLTTELAQTDRYYTTALRVYHNVTQLYPHSRIYTVGHSMGGAMASLIGLTFSVPSVSFESVPQRLPALRLGLAVAPDPHFSAAWHFGHTADPVYMGACNGYASSCALAGYAFESACFTGLRCIYDTVADKGWRLSINTHRINNVIPQVLMEYDDVPVCTGDLECGECGNWYFDF